MSTMEIRERLIPEGTWNVDPAHSTVEVAVKHMMIATVRGRFGDFEATLTGGDHPSLTGSIGITSIDTQDENRDAHLQAPDFFDAERYPRATFTATRFEPGRVVGELTLKGVTRELELQATYTGEGTDPWGNERIGLDLEGEIDRTDFGINWNQPLPSGGVLVSDRVKLIASFSAIKAG